MFYLAMKNLQADTEDYYHQRLVGIKGRTSLVGTSSGYKNGGRKTHRRMIY